MRFGALTDPVPIQDIGHADAGLNQAARSIATRLCRGGASQGTIRRRNPQAQTDKTCDGEGGVYRPSPPTFDPSSRLPLVSTACASPRISSQPASNAAGPFRNSAQTAGPSQPLSAARTGWIAHPAQGDRAVSFRQRPRSVFNRCEQRNREDRALCASHRGPYGHPGMSRPPAFAGSRRHLSMA